MQGERELFQKMIERYERERKRGRERRKEFDRTGSGLVDVS